MASSFFRRAWLLAALLPASLSHAQVTPTPGTTPSGAEKSLGTQVDLVGTDYNITGGTRRGSNLFHSFGTFSVPLDHAAIFLNTPERPDTSNIIGRVTGGRSEIFGRINSFDFGNANLFLINPAGWLFGPTAALEVGGSFHASTAHYLSFPDGRFYADPNREMPGSTFLSAPPVAFGFLGPSADIDVQLAFLQVPEGQTLSLVGQNVNVQGDLDFGISSVLFAPSGRVQVGAFASAGEATVEGLNGNFAALGNIAISSSTLAAIDIDADPAFVNGGTVLLRGGEVNISGFSVIDTSGMPFDFTLLQGTAGGPVIIRGGRLFVDSSIISSSTFGDANGGAIDLSMSESISLTNASTVVTTASAEFAGLGQGGNVLVSAPEVSLYGSSVTTSTLGAGGAGNVSFNVGTLAATAGGGIGSSSFGDGAGGDVAVTATDSVAISGQGINGASGIFTLNGALGAGGSLTVSAAALVMSDGGILLSRTDTQGDGGNIGVTVGELRMTGLSTISSRTLGGGEGGAITVSVGGDARISDSDGSNASGVFSNSCQICPNKPGDITLSARNLSVTDGGLIQSGVIAEAQGANITIVATEGILISAGGGVATYSNDRPAGIIAISSPSLNLSNGFIGASTQAEANAGAISLSVGALTLTAGGQIASSSEVVATGDGGNVTISANSISISGTSSNGMSPTPFGTDPTSGIYSTTRGSGDAGQIQISSGVLSLTDGGKISVSTSGAGSAGTIVASVGNFNVAGGGRIESSTTGGGAGGSLQLNGTVLITGADSGLFSTASGTGNAGSITVTGPTVTVSNGGAIDSSTTGAGAGGAINVNASSEVNVNSGGSIRADSLGSGFTGQITVIAGDRIVMENGSISTRAATSDGGDIVLNAPNLIRLDNSQVTTSVESSTGGGGNISIDPEFMILQGSTISANAFGGPGGNVTIVANNFVADAFSTVEASSALSTPGTVRIQSPDNNLASDIAQLPSAPIDASRLMQGSCSARRAGTPSSFQVAGRGGVPADPDGYLPTSGISGAPFAPRTAQTSGFALLAMSGWDCWR